MKLTSKKLLLGFVILTEFLIFMVNTSDLSNLDPLLNTQERVVEALENYIESEVKRLEKIKRFAREYEKLHDSARNNVDNFLSSPINSYLLVKRLAIDWDFAWNLIKDGTNKGFIRNLHENFPNNYDEEEAATAVIRLQETYLLNTTDLASGEVAGLKGATDLTASDCFLLGINAQDKKNYGLAVSWFQQSMDRFNEDEFQLLSKTLLLEVHAFSAYQIGDIERALQLAQDISKIDPHFPNIENILKLFEEELIKKTEDNNDSKANYENLKSEIAINEPPEEVDPTVLDVGKYRKLCRGEKTRTPDQERKLKCRYTSNGSTYLLLQPAKEEVLNVEPRIVVYHDVIRDKDIELLKELADKRLERAFVTDSGTGVKEYSNDRLSKNANIEDSVHPRVSHISKMIGEVTGLDMKAAENLQINKYGIGGYYAAHCDYRRISEKAALEWLLLGNRIATWLFYLSDVLAGGSTVFPNVGVEVKPIKGTAAFWYNLFPSGEGDLRTKHAACPVIAGEKWVANKWIHEAGQEFRRPCGLNPLHTSLIKYTQ